MSPRRSLGRRFFAGDTLEVARALLGCRLRFRECEGIIVETEAYKTDGASHYRTRRVKGRPLADTWGEVYVYLNYGMYHLLNFTTEEDGIGAVLIRALQPTAGLEAMMERRETADPFALASGPGKVCAAFGIDMRQHGRPVGEEIEIFARRGTPGVAVGPRIGITRDAHLPWRFMIPENPYVSGVPRRLRKQGRS